MFDERRSLLEGYWRGFTPYWLTLSLLFWIAVMLFQVRKTYRGMRSSLGQKGSGKLS